MIQVTVIENFRALLIPRSNSTVVEAKNGSISHYVKNLEHFSVCMNIEFQDRVRVVYLILLTYFFVASGRVPECEANFILILRLRQDSKIIIMVSEDRGD